MKIIITLIYLFFVKTTFTQTIPANSKLVDSISVATIFTDSVKATLGISIPIYKVFEYVEKTNLHYLVLMENEYSKVDEKPLYNKIKLVDVISNNGVLKFHWAISDTLRKENKMDYPELSVWIWTKYLQLTDIDGDEIVEPIVVYGTKGENGISDGRIKIIILYKSKKHAIRHQNSDQDAGRFTQVDKAFYTLPKKIQTTITQIMTQIANDGNGIFPYGWQNNMKLKKLKFDEKN